ncbi:hypothetical protein [Williamsoniiplasma lucivorax]|uniref:Uncharacterized protein n=1 Tax=Williamsoniiplasma lucivorax TaxID=209274 RepID=A0A2S5RFI7_9MOLU|nr:hypothetical protein [Williamsoniiplasma lucivorax]PPE06058.1 hypothetical protein ELUCI_v1c03490 [Williamsoniiplasma lucivorax]
MLYIGEQAVLIEVQTKDDLYLIGDEIFEVLPNKIASGILSSANWNRALRYKNNHHDQFHHLGYFLIRFELYLKDRQIICLSKNSFEQKILQQNKFQNEFLQEIFTFRNRNLKHFKPSTIPVDVDDMNLVDQINLDFNRVWMSDNYQVNKSKFKLYFKTGPFAFEQNKHNQTIYYFENKHFQNWDLIDFKTSLFYLQGSFGLNVQAHLILEKENKQLAQEIMEQLVNEIKNSQTIKTNLKPWHLYNVTQDEQIIIATLNELGKQLEYTELIDYLNQLFKTLKINYFPLLFANPEIQKIFTKTAKTEASQSDLQKNIARFNCTKKPNLHL